MGLNSVELFGRCIREDGYSSDGRGSSNNNNGGAGGLKEVKIEETVVCGNDDLFFG
jgi:hypothetical protein